MPNFVPYNTVCQLSHFAWGALIVMVAAFFGHPVVGVGLLLTWAVPKELLYDIVVEGDTWPDSCEDLGFYILGGVVGMLAVCIKLAMVISGV